MSLDIQTGFESIFSVVDKEIENLVLIYGHTEPNTFQAMAFQVNQINRRTHRIYNLPTLAGGTPLDSGYFGESGHSQEVTNPGDPITRIETNFNETIIEYGFSVEPDGVLCWAENPGGNHITGLQGERLRGLGPGRDAAAVWSDWTKTKDGVPTTALSANPWQGLFRIDSSDKGRNNIYVGFENKQNHDAPLQVFAVGMLYRVTDIEDPGTIENMVFGEGYNRRVATWGGLQNSSPNLPEWTTIQLKGEDVKGVLTGGKK